MRNIQTLRRHQSGATLIIGMIILILLMLIGLASMKTSDIQFQLAGNLQFENAAMNNAETTLHTAETWLRTGSNYRNAGLGSDACNSRSVNHLYPLNRSVTPPAPCLPGYGAPDNDPLTMTWTDANSLALLDDSGDANPSQRYIIELMSVNNRLLGSGQAVGGRANSGCNQVNTYRITARGTSARGASKFVQSFFSVLSC